MQNKGIRKSPILLSNVAKQIEVYAIKNHFGGKAPSIRRMAQHLGIPKSTWDKLINGGFNYEFSTFELVADYLERCRKVKPVCDDAGLALPTDAKVLARLDAEAKDEMGLTLEEAVRKIKECTNEYVAKVDEILKRITD